MNYWKSSDIDTILPFIDEYLNSSAIKSIAISINRSEQATRRKILEIIGVCDKSNVVKSSIESNKFILPPTDFPELDKSFIPNSIFSEVLANRKLKLKLGDRVLIREQEDVFRFLDYNSKHFNFLGKTLTVNAIYGKSFG